MVRISKQWRYSLSLNIPRLDAETESPGSEKSFDNSWSYELGYEITCRDLRVFPSDEVL